MASRDRRRRPRSKCRCLVGALAVAAFSVSPSAAAPLDALQLATALSEIGPRVPGSEPHRRAIGALLGWMTAAGLQSVEVTRVPGHPALRLLSGLLPGESGREILLSAHFDSVAGSPGAADNAAGCAVVLAAAARLAQLPRHHSIRILLFDGEEQGLLGSTAWVGSLDERLRDSVLAAINVDLVGWDDTRRGSVLSLLTRRDGSRRMAPGWLVSAAVEAAQAIGAPVSVGSESLSVLGQVLARTLQLNIATDAEALLAQGIPALTLSDADVFSGDPANHSAHDTVARLSATALDRWVQRLGAVVRRLDVLSSRPRDDEEYLAFFGRIWSRRDLYWMGLAVWVALVFQGLPGSWRATAAADRRLRGLRYLPGFALRFLFLGCVLMLPVFTVIMLLPAAILGLLPRRFRLPPRWSLPIAVTPVVLILAGALWLVGHGRVSTIALGLPAAALLSACLATQLWLLASPGTTLSTRQGSAVRSRGAG